MPDQMPPPSPQQADQQDQSGVKDAMVGVNTNLLKVKEAIANVSDIPDDLKSTLDELIQEYQQFVQDMGAVARGEQPSPQADKGADDSGAPSAPTKGPVPMTGGPKAVPAY